MRERKIKTIKPVSVSGMAGEIIFSGIKKGLYNFTTDLMHDIKDALVKLAKKQRELAEKEKQLKKKYEKRKD